MSVCGLCGAEYDELRYQVVVVELHQGFDRIDCAVAARRAIGRSGDLARRLIAEASKPTERATAVEVRVEVQRAPAGERARVDQ